MEMLAGKGPELVAKTVEHLMLTGVSTGVAVLVGLPLGIWITRRAWSQSLVLGSAGVIQTIPSLAMLAFLLPLLGIGIKPALVALTLYAILPIVRNTYTGLREVSPEVIEAAQGLGFTNRQRLWLVEIPLALPIIVAGIRTATVIGVGIATLSAFIGAGGLGDFINRGLALNNTGLILLGAIPSALLALMLDFGIGILETLLSPGERTLLVKVKTALFVGLVLVSGTFAASILQRAEEEPKEHSTASNTVRIGSKNYTEQLILAELMAQRIEGQTGLNVDRRLNLGGTVVCHRALVNGELDLYAEYTGTALTAILKHGTVDSPSEAYQIVAAAYASRFSCQWLRPFGFNNTYTITVRRADARDRGWKHISDLTRAAPSLSAGFTAEFSVRPDGYPGLRKTYGFGFAKVFDLDPGLMYKAVAKGEVDLICAFATDGRIAAYDLVPLEDDKRFFPPYFAAPVLRTEILEAHPELATALAPLGGVIDDGVMQKLNYQVDEQGRGPAAVARAFLETLEAGD